MTFGPQQLSDTAGISGDFKHLLLFMHRSVKSTSDRHLLSAQEIPAHICIAKGVPVIWLHQICSSQVCLGLLFTGEPCSRFRSRCGEIANHMLIDIGVDPIDSLGGVNANEVGHLLA